MALTSSAVNNMTLENVYKLTLEKLQKAGADAPAFDTIWLMGSVLDITKQDLLVNPEREVSEEDTEKILLLADRRIKGEPVQYLAGFEEFFGRKFFVGEGVLIPRDDTEVVLCSTFPYLDKLTKEKNVKILDLCSGSGILAITLKKQYPQAEVTAVEISDKALRYLRKNAEYHNADIRIIHDDIFNCTDEFAAGEFDLIISNPPYVRTYEMQKLQNEVRFEPALALEGGEDGCDFYRRIVPIYKEKIRAGGMLAFEYDSDQADIISSLMQEAGFENITVFDDLGGVHRAINGTMLNI